MNVVPFNPYVLIEKFRSTDEFFEFWAKHQDILKPLLKLKDSAIVDALLSEKNLEVCKWLLLKKHISVLQLRHASYFIDNTKFYEFLFENNLLSKQDIKKIANQLLKHPKTWRKLFSNIVFTEYCFNHELFDKKCLDLSKKTHLEEFFVIAHDVCKPEDLQRFFNLAEKSTLIQNVEKYICNFSNKFEHSKIDRMLGNINFSSFILNSSDQSLFEQYLKLLRRLESTSKLVFSSKTFKCIQKNSLLTPESAKIFLDIPKQPPIPYSVVVDLRRTHIAVINQPQFLQYLLKNCLYDANDFVNNILWLDCAYKLLEFQEARQEVFSLANRLTPATLQSVHKYLKKNEQHFDSSLIEKTLSDLRMHEFISTLSSSSENLEAFRKSLDDSKIEQIREVIYNGLQDAFSSLEDLQLFLNKGQRSRTLNI